VRLLGPQPPGSRGPSTRNNTLEFKTELCAGTTCLRVVCWDIGARWHMNYGLTLGPPMTSYCVRLERPRRRVLTTLWLSPASLPVATATAAPPSLDLLLLLAVAACFPIPPAPLLGGSTAARTGARAVDAEGAEGSVLEIPALPARPMDAVAGGAERLASLAAILALRRSGGGNVRAASG
jgi:hypothetical protein